MKTSDFYFDLPHELIAQKPSAVRGEDRLMLLEKRTGSVSHFVMSDLPRLVESGTLMVFNDSRVRKSRCFAHKAGSEREHEFLFIDKVDSTPCTWKCITKGSRKVKLGSVWQFQDGREAEVIPASAGDDADGVRYLRFASPLSESWFETNGHVPLPPYIKRADSAQDSERYQTVYAKEAGSAACPTAGLHFTQQLLQQLKEEGIELAWITLHVGLGTFLPVRAENVEDHVMHEEHYTITHEAAQLINDAKRQGRAVLAVGTTSVRCLESSGGEDGMVEAGRRSTRIFIYPGYKFKVVDELLTNFHTPESTLLMLVSAFVGKENILSAYKTAVLQKYRFFSYGDAMLIK